MPVISKPSLYSFSGNCADIVVVSLSKVNFKLTIGAVVLTEAYTPYMGQVTIPMRSLLESLIKGLDATQGSKPITKVTYIVDTVEESFYCLSGGVRDVGNIDAWLKNNFLTWRPQVVRTTFHAPQYLSYVALVGCTVKAKGYFANGDQVVDLKTLSAGTLYNIDVTWGNLVGKFRESPKYVDLWVEGTGVKTYTQRFCLMQNADCQDVFVWANSVGGVDTAIFTGDLVHTQNSSSSTAIVDRAEVEFDVDYSSVYKKYTGYITDGNDQLWTLDFFNSALKYHLSDSSLRRIVVSKPKTERTKGEIAGYEFDFSYSDQSKYLNLPRLGDDQLLVFLEEGEELFFLTPRLNSFAGVSVGVGDILFPVQYAHLEQWFKMPLADILSMFTIGPHSHQIGDVVGLDDRLTELENRPGGGGGGIPDAHASSHAEGGSDLITPDSIGASAKAHNHGDIYASKDHTHDDIYASKDHTHDDIYASNAHTHDDRYAKKNGNQLEDFATKNLDVKGIAIFNGMIAMTNATGGGGGGADLPEGNLNDLLYYNGSEWVGKHKDTFGFLTDGALVGYATQAWVIERIPNIPAWAMQPNKPSYGWTEIVNKPTTMGGFGITDGVLTSDVRLTNARPASDVYAWAKQATKPAYSGSEIANNYHTGNANLATVDWRARDLNVAGTAIFNGMIAMTNATGGGGGTSDYNELENLPFIGGIKVSGSKSLVDYGLMNHGLATQDWVNTRIPNVYAWALQAVKPAYGWTEITGKPTSMPASDVYAWAKASVKPTYTASEVGALAITGGTLTGELIIGKNFISHANESYGVMLFFDGTRTIIGSMGVSTSAATHLRSKTGHVTCGAGNNPTYTMYDTGNLAPASVNNAGNTLVQRAANGYIYGAIYHDNYPTQNSPIGQIGYRLSQENGFHHFCTPDHFKAQLGLWSTSNFDPNSKFNINEARGLNNTSDANRNTVWFDYNWAGTSKAGSVISFSGLGGWYNVELFGDYLSGANFGVRARHGDAGVWHPVRWLYHTGNQQPSLPISGHNINALSYYQTDGSFEGSPSVWASYIILGHGDSSSYYANILRFPFHEANGAPQYQRKVGGVNSDWKTFWTVENCGSSAFDWSMRNATIAGSAIINGTATIGSCLRVNLTNENNYTEGIRISGAADGFSLICFNAIGYSGSHADQWMVGKIDNGTFVISNDTKYLTHPAISINKNNETTFSGTATANGFRVKDDNGMWQGSKYTGGLRDIDVTIVSVTGNVILYPYAGNVGIGTNNPTAKLHVNGNQTVEGTAIFKGAIIMNNY